MAGQDEEIVISVPQTEDISALAVEGEEMGGGLRAGEGMKGREGVDGFTAPAAAGKVGRRGGSTSGGVRSRGGFERGQGKGGVRRMVFGVLGFILVMGWVV